MTLGVTGQPSSANTVLQKLIHVGDTAATIALVFAQELNRGYTGVWASASGSVLTITARTMGLAGDANTVAASTTSGGFTATVSGLNFTAGADGDWRTDLTASPALNRAVRDWSSAYFTALVGYGIDAAASFSMELGNGDPSVSAGIAQTGSGGRSDSAADAVAADEFFADESGVLAGGVCGDGGYSGGGGADSVSAIRRSAVVVFS